MPLPTRRLALRSLALFLAASVTRSAFADPDDAEAPEGPPPIAHGVAPAKPSRPQVRLDRLDFPAGLAQSDALERHFRKELRRAAYHADWGAGRGAKIEYRVKIEELSIRDGDRVVHVRCTAMGSLPKGRTTRTFIDFGGNPADRQRVVEHVLEIVAHGVVTRLAAIERARRLQAAGG